MFTGLVVGVVGVLLFVIGLSASAFAGVALTVSGAVLIGSAAVVLAIRTAMVWWAAESADQVTYLSQQR